MLRQHASMVSLVARGLDAIAVVVTGWLASVLLFGALGPTPLRYQTYQFALLLAALLTLVVFPACGVYQSWRGQRMRAIVTLGLSARATHRVLRIARTCADLATSDTLDMPHLAEALQYRLLDRRHQPGY